ncbi:RHS repeat protein [Brevibacterium sp. JNUCC-42]|nr:RHS repeat protein [Brevibacterium sp. JNUCC-42]
MKISRFLMGYLQYVWDSVQGFKTWQTHLCLYRLAHVSPLIFVDAVRCTTYTYDENGRLSKTVRPNGTIEQRHVLLLPCLHQVG